MELKVRNGKIIEVSDGGIVRCAMCKDPVETFRWEKLNSKICAKCALYLESNGHQERRRGFPIQLSFPKAALVVANNEAIDRYPNIKEMNKGSKPKRKRRKPLVWTVWDDKKPYE